MATRRPLAALLLGFGLLALLPGRTGAASVPSGFVETQVIGGRTAPTAVRFAPDGRVFVAEKSGRLFLYDDVDDPSPVQVVDLRASVYNYWDRGFLGLAVHPDFPTTPEVYVLYSHDTWPPGDPRFGDPTQPRWGAGEPTPTDDDPCPTPPGPTNDGCVTYSRLSRLVLDPGTFQATAEQVLIEGAWCQQYPSHSIADLAFGPDGYLYVSAGEGAAFHRADFGQDGNPVNPCGDPPGGSMDGPDAEGGALRAQDLLSAGDPTGLHGSVLRVDVSTTPISAPPDNPLVGVGAADDDLVVATGLRNPFRIAFRPGTHELWIGDVGWNTWEELNRVVDPLGQVENFGWPCYEGTARQGGYDQQDLCQTLYAGGEPPWMTLVPPYWRYRHSDAVVSGDGCGSGGSSIAGVAFAGPGFPPAYGGALFFADSTRRCIWTLFADASGLPDPGSVAPFVTGSAGPIVDLQWGPDDGLYYVDLGSGAGTGRVMRVQPAPANQRPTASLVATPPGGASPLSVQLDASGSSDPEDGTNLVYDWDLDGDGQFGDAAGATASATYTEAGLVTVSVRVEDTQGASDLAHVQVAIDDGPPVVSLDEPPSGLRWVVDQIVGFSGSATDPEDGPLPASRLTWELAILHCFDLDDCHTHGLTTETGVASGTLVAPDHDWPSFLEFKLTARDLPQAGWWDEAWPWRRLLVADASGLGQTLADVPVLVTLDPSRIDYAATSPGGADLRFVAPGGQVLPHEVESWVPGGTSRVWVRVSSIPAGGSASFWMYYGNPAATPAEDPTGVWAPDHAAVWHLHGGASDATGAGHDGVEQGTTPVPGAVGNGRAFDGASWIDVASAPGLEITGPLTLEAWVALDDPDANATWRLLSKKSDPDAGAGYDLAVEPLANVVSARGSGADPARAWPVALDAAWHHLAVVHAGDGTARIFVDGVERTSDPGVSSLAVDAQGLRLGGTSGGGDLLVGALDEVRIAPVARSADWVRAQFLSMTDALLAVGPPEALAVQQTTVSRQIEAEAVPLDFETVPTGLELSVGAETATAPFQVTRVVNGLTTVSAPSRQVLSGVAYGFESWSDAGAATHDVVTPPAPATLTATYRLLLACEDGLDNDGDGAIDWDGGPGGEPADADCGGDPSGKEKSGSRCGLGAELALALPLLAALRRGLRGRRGRA